MPRGKLALAGLETEVLRLHDDGLGPREIASRLRGRGLEISHQAVSLHLTRRKKRLKMVASQDKEARDAWGSQLQEFHSLMGKCKRTIEEVIDRLHGADDARSAKVVVDGCRILILHCERMLERLGELAPQKREIVVRWAGEPVVEEEVVMVSQASGPPSPHP